MARLFLPSPLPPEVPAVVPVFLPFAGCPGRCLYCAQNLQTGEKPAPLAARLEKARAMLLLRREKGLPPAELAFYGGTFTAQAQADLEACLRAAGGFLREGLVSSWRCSTRPDALSPDLLARMRDEGCGLVELGIQSYDEGVLSASGRGYGARLARDAQILVQKAELPCGVQLLPGLPGSTAEGFLADVRQALALGAALLRFYPCLVVRGTVLAEMYARGRYAPWSEEGTLAALAEGLLLAQEEDVPVIRIGVAREEAFEAQVLAGPRDPDLGARVRVRAFRLALERALPEGESVTRAFLPRRTQGLIFGRRDGEREALARLGLVPSRVVWGGDGGIELETGPAEGAFPRAAAPRGESP